MFISLPTPPPAQGPPCPLVLPKAGAVPSSGFDPNLALRRMMVELGATVVVEGEFLDLPTLPSAPRVGPLRLRLGQDLLAPGQLAPGALPVPVWMDPSVTRAGGTIVGRSFAFGGAGW